MADALLRTPLYAWHVAHGARMVPFGGWSMPVQYPTGILAEHRAVRARAGLFDISHMGRVGVAGADAATLLQYTTTNDVAALALGRAQYSLVCHPDGGAMDDVLVYGRGEEGDVTPSRYLVVVNAGNRPRVIAWWRDQIAAHGWDVALTDQTGGTAMMALQGPAVEELLQPHTDAAIDTMRYYSARRERVLGHAVLLARTGYTGEDGFELVCAADAAADVWAGLLALGAAAQVVPCGLGARDTLRLEAGLPLYGHELRDDITPLEAGLARFVKLGKGAFVGAAALADQAARGVGRQIVGFELLDAGVPRQGYDVLDAGAVVGEVTSGTIGPSVDAAIGMALVPARLAAAGSEFAVGIRGRAARARVRSLPFWPHRSKRVARGGRA